MLKELAGIAMGWAAMAVEARGGEALRLKIGEVAFGGAVLVSGFALVGALDEGTAGDASLVLGGASLMLSLLGGGGTSATPAPCSLRLDATGLSRNGVPLTPAQAVSQCAGGAELLVTGNANFGLLEQVQSAFRSANVPLNTSQG